MSNNQQTDSEKNKGRKEVPEPSRKAWQNIFRFAKGADEISPPGEQRRRKREIVIIFIASFLFVFLTWFEIRLFATSQTMPFMHSIFFFGLVNFNIVLLLLLLFLIFRNVVKVFVERKGKLFGSSLKAKLIAAFVAFSVIPTLLMFVISVFYINSSFDKWFSVKMVGVLKSSLEVQNAFYFNTKKKNYHFAHEIARQVRTVQTPMAKQKKMVAMASELALESVEFYPSMFGQRILVIGDKEALTEVPAVSLEFLQKGIKGQSEASTIHQFGDGNLVRVIVPVQEGKDKGAIVVSSFVPLSLISRMNDVSSAYEEFRDINPLEYPLKSIYLIILILMTLVILFAAVWFGFHLARQLSIPLVQLGRATKRVADGDYSPLNLESGSEEISALISAFNSMTGDLESSEKSLKETLRYIEVVLRHVSTGVISIDKAGVISTINGHAAKLLKLEPSKYVGRSVRELLTLEYFRMFAEMLKTMQQNKIESIQREFTITIGKENLPLSMNLSILKDENGEEVGKIVVFDDLTPIVNAQRAAAWTEVARRIAHEVKNPLTPIRLSAERLQKKFGQNIEDPAFKECTTMIIRQVDDMKNLVNEFSNFARLPQSRPVLASLQLVIDEVFTLYRQAHPQIQFVSNADTDLPQFKFDPSQLKRVLLNLVDNSVGAMAKQKEGAIEISTKFDAEIKTVRITVADTGPGIPAADRNRVFEPYFSTKETGTGLGLPIVKRIIEDHNGFIRALANEPKGTKMVIELPIQVGQNWNTKDKER